MGLHAFYVNIAIFISNSGCVLIGISSVSKWKIAGKVQMRISSNFRVMCQIFVFASSKIRSFQYNICTNCHCFVLSLPPLCEINEDDISYVDMKYDYVNLQFIHVSMPICIIIMLNTTLISCMSTWSSRNSHICGGFISQWI